MQSSSRAADFLARRLQLLPRDTLKFLTAGAIFGKEFELDLAAALARQSFGQVIAALDVARQRQLVWVRADGSRCVFVHDKIRWRCWTVIQPMTAKRCICRQPAS